MTESEARALLEGIVRRVFQAPTYALDPGDPWERLPNWDSLNYVRLVVEAQKAFGVKIGALAAGQFRTVGDMLGAVGKGPQGG